MFKFLIYTFILVTYVSATDNLPDLNKYVDESFESLPIKDLAKIVSKTDGINIIIGSDVNASSSIFIAKKPKNLMKAFEISLHENGYRLLRQNGFYYIKSDFENSENSYYIYQFKSQIYDDLKPILKNVKHTYIRQLNRLVFYANSENSVRIFDILSRVDKKRLDYNFKVTIFSIDDNLMKSKGFDTSIVSKFTGNSVNYFIDMLRVTSTKSIPLLNDDSKVGFYSFVNFLDRNHFAKIETSTIVNTLDQKKSIINNVRQMPVLKSTQELVDTNQKNTNSYDYQDVGLKLELTPRFTSIDDVTVDFMFDYSMSTPSNDEFLPTFSRKFVNNVLRLKKGEALLVGGFHRSEINAERGGVPLLRDVPLIGEIFKNSKSISNDVVTYIVIEYMSAASKFKMLDDYKKSKKIKKSSFKLDDSLDLF